MPFVFFVIGIKDGAGCKEAIEDLKGTLLGN